MPIIPLLLKVRLSLKTVLFNPGDAPAFTVSPKCDLLLKTQGG